MSEILEQFVVDKIKFLEKDIEVLKQEIDKKNAQLLEDSYIFSELKKLLIADAYHQGKLDIEYSQYNIDTEAIAKKLEIELSKESEDSRGEENEIY